MCARAGAVALARRTLKWNAAVSAYELLRLFLLHFAALFPLVNPFDTVPLFLAVTKHSTPEHRALTARRAAFYATIMMVAALLLGHTFLLFIGVSISALRVAGGVVSVVLGFQLLFPRGEEHDEPKAPEQRPTVDYSLMPLAFPAICGAGEIAMIMTMSGRAVENESWRIQAQVYAVNVAVIVVTGFLAWVVLRSSIRLARALGIRGLDALGKLMGIVLITIGVQLVATGVTGFIDDPPRAEAVKE